ncbi:paraoxonase 2 [Exophiala viscosa]|uniref:Paraoxonase 2 n=1 Tax=Exophiala viscosa TaxID=2486360 RepID=A0AAN6ID87_9EURO|nr:paraoxonase 2 [Exophiala viscosa]
MSRLKNIVSIILPLVPLLLYSQSEYLLRLAGRVHIDKARLVRWEDSTALNSGDCQVIHDANACEDVKIHYASSTAFLACGDPFERTHWYPCAGVRIPSLRAESSFREQLFKHDIKTGKTTELELRGFEGDFITHGIDIFPIDEGFSKIRIFAVNHARDGDSIAIFDHELGSDAVDLVKNVKHPNIKTANGVAAVGPMEFYLTNDHYFAGGPGRTFEETFGPWSWATHVQYCEAASEDVSCRQVTGTFPGANGINIWKDRLFIGDSQNGTLRIFDIHDDKNVTQLQMIDLGAAADNINILPTTGDPIVAVFPTLEDLPKYLRNVKSLGKELLVPAAALRLDSANDYAPSLAYFNDGSAISFMTAAAADPYNDVFIGAGVLQYGGFAVCKVPPGTFA